MVNQYIYLGSTFTPHGKENMQVLIISLKKWEKLSFQFKKCYKNQKGTADCYLKLFDFI